MNFGFINKFSGPQQNLTKVKLMVYLFSLDPSPPLELKLCVSVKRKLQVSVQPLIWESHLFGKTCTGACIGIRKCNNLLPKLLKLICGLSVAWLPWCCQCFVVFVLWLLPLRQLATMSSAV